MSAQDYWIPPSAKALQDRDRVFFGSGYDKNESLEAKRREAIQWLREHSKNGWVLDTVIRHVPQLLQPQSTD